VGPDLLVRGALRKRGDELPAQTRYNMPIELLYTVLPFLIIAVLFYYTAVVQTSVDKIRRTPTSPSRRRLQVELAVRLPGREGRQRPAGVHHRRERLRTDPGGTDAQADPVRGERQDVIHSFWVPELLFKRDVFPGNVTNTFEVTIEKQGAYVGRCAELCGTYHSMMNFELRAVTFDEYQKFLAAKQQGMSTPDALTAAGDPDPFAIKTKPFNTTAPRATRADGPLLGIEERS